jgi:hypothetical protein
MVPNADTAGVNWDSVVQGAGFRVQGAGFRVQGAGCRVEGSDKAFEVLNHVNPEP